MMDGELIDSQCQWMLLSNGLVNESWPLGNNNEKRSKVMEISHQIMGDIYFAAFGEHLYPIGLIKSSRTLQAQQRNGQKCCQGWCCKLQNWNILIDYKKLANLPDIIMDKLIILVTSRLAPHNRSNDDITHPGADHSCTYTSQESENIPAAQTMANA